MLMSSFFFDDFYNDCLVAITKKNAMLNLRCCTQFDSRHNTYPNVMVRPALFIKGQNIWNGHDVVHIVSKQIYTLPLLWVQQIKKICCYAL